MPSAGRAGSSRGASNRRRTGSATISNFGGRATSASTTTPPNCRRRNRGPSKKLDIVAEPGKTSFTTTRIVDAPRTLVFDAFTKCEHLKRWLGPRALTMVSCESDLRPGGRYRFVLRTPDGADVGFSGEFREIVRP